VYLAFVSPRLIPPFSEFLKAPLSLFPPSQKLFSTDRTGSAFLFSLRYADGNPAAAITKRSSTCPLTGGPPSTHLRPYATWALLVFNPGGIFFFVKGIPALGLSEVIADIFPPGALSPAPLYVQSDVRFWFFSLAVSPLAIIFPRDTSPDPTPRFSLPFPVEYFVGGSGPFQ